MSGNWFNVGKIVNTHGIRGEVKIWPTTDFAEERFKPGTTLTVWNETMDKSVEAVVESARAQKKLYVVKFKGWSDINEVERYKGWSLKVAESQLEELPENEYYYHQIVGCTVVTGEGETLGVITEILSPGANDVWVVKPSAGKEIYIPYIADVVTHVDVAGKRVTVQLMEGLL